MVLHMMFVNIFVNMFVNMFEVLEAGLLSTKITHQSRTDADRILEVETLRLNDSLCVTSD